jgi:hypothetical protein
MRHCRNGRRLAYEHTVEKDDTDPEELTTADLAKVQTGVSNGEQAEIEAGRMRPVRSDRAAWDRFVSDRAGEVERNDDSSADVALLFPGPQLQQLQAQWNDIQTGFVDEPRSAVQSADRLVASTMQQLAEAFTRERSRLEQQWDRSDSVSTEDLRLAFQRYRSFFHRLLSL